LEGRAICGKGERGKKGGELEDHCVHIVECRRGKSVVRSAVKWEVLISGNSMRVEKFSSPCITCLLMCFTDGGKSINDLIKGSNAERRGRFVRMRSGGSVRQMEKNVTPSDKFRGGEVDTRTAR